MRFRIPQQGAQDLAGGVGNMLSAVMLAPMYEAQAADDMQSARAKRDLLDAQTISQRAAADASMAHAALFKKQAETEADTLDRRGLGSMIGTAALMNGVHPSEVPDFTQYAQTGQMPGRFAAPVDGVGPVQPTPSYYTDGTAQKIFRALGLSQQALTLGDKNVENLAKASGMYRTQGLGDDVLAGRRSAGDVGQAQAAAAGSKLIDNIGNTGSGFNQFTGAGVALDPRLQTLFQDQGTATIGRDNAAAGASRASAANSFASASQHKAQTDKIRQDIDLGNKGTLQQTDQGLLLVDPRTGTAKAVVGPDGRPVAGKGASLNGEQANALTFGNRMMAADGILNKLAEKGVFTPGTATMAAQGLPEWAGRGAAEYGANFTQSSAQQQVEQAQRDFVNAVLRRESGAAISMGEFTNAQRQYFPQPGDSKQVIAQKARSRRLVIEGMLAAVPQGLRPALPPAASAPEGTWGPPAGGRTVTVDY